MPRIIFQAKDFAVPRQHHWSRARLKAFTDLRHAVVSRVAAAIANGYLPPQQIIERISEPTDHTRYPFRSQRTWMMAVFVTTGPARTYVTVVYFGLDDDGRFKDCGLADILHGDNVCQVHYDSAVRNGVLVIEEIPDTEGEPVDVCAFKLHHFHAPRKSEQHCYSIGSMGVGKSCVAVSGGIGWSRKCWSPNLFHKTEDRRGLDWAQLCFSWLRLEAIMRWIMNIIVRSLDNEAKSKGLASLGQNVIGASGRGFSSAHSTVPARRYMRIRLLRMKRKGGFRFGVHRSKFVSNADMSMRLD